MANHAMIPTTIAPIWMKNPTINAGMIQMIRSALVRRFGGSASWRSNATGSLFHSLKNPGYSSKCNER